MENLKEFEYTEENAKDAPVTDVKWHGKEIEFGSELMQDVGKGKPIILRKFDFAKNPSVELPSKEQIAETYQKFIDTFLWKDSLVRIDNLKVIIEKDKFTVFATCQAKAGAVLLEKPLKIQDYASSKHLD
jgi:hypothetical protein